MNYSFSDAMRGALQGARDEALRRGDEWVGAEHMLLALLAADGTRGWAALVGLGIDPLRLRSEVESGLGARASGSSSAMIPYSDSGKAALQASMMEAAELDRRDVDTGLFLMGLLQVLEGRVAEVVWSSGLSLGDLEGELRSVDPALG